jgi:hypothetical protein
MGNHQIRCVASRLLVNKSNKQYCSMFRPKTEDEEFAEFLDAMMEATLEGDFK